METLNQLVTKNWDATTVDMMRKLKGYAVQLQNTVGADQLGRPVALVDVGALMATGLIKPLDKLLETNEASLYLPISYLEGMPTIYGTPIWEKLDGESVEYYELFKRYRSLLDNKGLRSIHKLAAESGVPIINLELLRQAHFWQLRVSAFDVYRKKEREYMMDFYRDEVQEKHRLKASELFGICTKYVTDNTQLLTPKSALEWAKLAVELERISVGLQPNKPGMIAEGAPANIVNIQNNLGAAANGTAATGNIDEDRLRLKQMLNVMGNIGLFKDVLDVEIEEVIEDGE